MAPGGSIELMSPVAFREEDIIAASRIAGFGSEISKNESGEMVFKKRVVKKFKLGASKKEEQKKPEANPWAKLAAQ